MAAHFRHSLVLAFAFPREVLEPLLPGTMTLDSYGEDGLAAIALVQTERLRPAFAPAALGRSFFLCGYRIFVRLKDAPSLRGLHILRSDTDKGTMVVFGNLLTHYRYGKADVTVSEARERLEIEVRTASAEADVRVTADLGSRPQSPPAGSPFPTLRDARRYAGPLPYTFDHDAGSGATVVVRGLRSTWDPRPVTVQVEQATFFDDPRFGGERPRLANAFHVSDVDYRWERGQLLQPEREQKRRAPSRGARRLPA